METVDKSLTTFMKQFYLAEIETRDKLIHQGIFFWPKKPTKKAILWVHGLASTFYSNVPLLTEFAKQCEELGVGFASFNNRGHDIVTGIKKVDLSNDKGYTRIGAGAGVETFKDSVHDIDAGVAFLHTQGFSKVIVVGHSTGSNKVCYYAATQNNPRVTGFVLAGPVSDLNTPGVDLAKITKNIQKMKTYIKKGKGDALLEGVYDLPLTPKRYVSLLRDEDMFDYFTGGKKLKTFLSKIHKPLMIVLGAKDEYLNKPARNALKAFDRFTVSPRYKSVVVRGGLHSFNGKERQFVHEVLQWVTGV